MASDQDIRAAVLDRMVSNYGQPKHVSDPTTKIGDYLAALRPFSPDVLLAAWARVVSHHRFTIWPEPSAIASACRDVLGDAAREAACARAKAEHPGHQASAASERERAADGAMRSGLGEEARRDGWSRSLWIAVREAGSLAKVSPERIDRMREAAVLARAQLAGWSAPPESPAHLPPPSLGVVVRMAKKMMEAERQHAARFGGK